MRLIADMVDQKNVQPGPGWKRFWKNYRLWKAKGDKAEIYIPNAQQLDVSAKSTNQMMQLRL